MIREKDFEVEIEELKKKVSRLEDLLLNRYNAPLEEVYNIVLSDLSSQKDIMTYIFEFLQEKDLKNTLIASKELREISILSYKKKFLENFPEYKDYFTLTKVQVNFIVLSFKLNKSQVRKCPICIENISLTEDEKNKLQTFKIQKERKRKEEEENEEKCDSYCPVCLFPAKTCYNCRFIYISYKM